MSNSPSSFYIPRDVEASLRQLLECATFKTVHVRGRRRVGKSTTTRHILEQIGRPFILLRVGSSEWMPTPNDFVDNFVGIQNPLILLLRLHLLIRLHQCGSFKLEQVLRGVFELGITVVFEEFQSASEMLQTALKNVIDEIDYQEVKNLNFSLGYGHLILIGSVPGAMDELLCDGRRSLFHRVRNTITIVPFNSEEFKAVFQRFNIMDPAVQLAFKTATCGLPLNLANLLVGKTALDLSSSSSSSSTDEKRCAIYNRIFCSSHTNTATLDVVAAVTGQYSALAATVVNTLLSQARADDQTLIKALETGHGLDPTAARETLKMLCSQYHLIERQYPLLSSTSEGQQSRWVVTDQFARLFNFVGKMITPGPQFNLSITDAAFCNLAQFEGIVLEEWLRDIIEERCDRNQPALPMPEFELLSGKVRVLRGSWVGFTDCKIDFVAEADSVGGATVLLGSCKRDWNAQNVTNLLTNVCKFYEQAETFRKVGDSIDRHGCPRTFILPQRVCLFQFSCDFPVDRPRKVQDRSQVAKQLAAAGLPDLEILSDLYHFSLHDMLFGMRSDV